MNTLYEEALEYLTVKQSTDEERRLTKRFLDNTIEEYGEVVKTYPTWHPLMQGGNPDQTYPSVRSGYECIDHTIYFANAFVTCPYGHGIDKLLASVKDIATLDVNRSICWISAKELAINLYNREAHPILVKCEWGCHDEFEKIPTKIALPLMLSHEFKSVAHAQCGESWERMKDWFTGEPRTAFISKETEQALKSTWELMNKYEVFGEVRY